MAGYTVVIIIISLTGNLFPQRVQQNTQTHQTQEDCPTMTNRENEYK